MMFLSIVLLLSAPLLLAALGELLLERSGSIQIGLEGTMLVGAFAAFAAARATGSPLLGLLAASVLGAVSGLAFALFAVALRADPILVGTAWNLLALGGTGFAYRLLAGETGAFLEIETLARRAGPLQVPWVVLLVYLLPVVVHVFLARSRPGLVLVAAGENPVALHAAGRSVVAIRTASSTVAGVLAGAGGGLLIVTVSPTFVEGVTAGRGFLALAIVVFARWSPLALVPTTLLIGGAGALQYQLQASGASNVPYALFLALPPILALVALSITSARGGAPKALGQPAP